MSEKQTSYSWTQFFLVGITYFGFLGTVAAGDRERVSLSLALIDQTQCEVVIRNDTDQEVWISDGIFNEQRYPEDPKDVFVCFVGGNEETIGVKTGTNHALGWNSQVSLGSVGQGLIDEMKLRPWEVRSRRFKIDRVIDAFRKEFPEATKSREGSYRVLVAVWTLSLTKGGWWKKCGVLQSTFEIVEPVSREVVE